MVTGTNNLVVQSTNTMAPASATTSTAIEAASSSRRVSDNRRSNKPIMEKRRRARINNSLNELKTLILDAMKKDPARHSKLEKADILEMTVKHLQNLQRQQVAMSAATDPSVVNKFRAGFSECANEVGRYPGLDPIVRRRLLQHLASCINHGGANCTKSLQEISQVQVHILPNSTGIVDHQANNGIILSNGNGTGGFQLVPTRLPNGDFALVLPTAATTTTPAAATATSVNVESTTQSSSPMIPLLVPIPQRTASTASSSSSNYTPSHSPELVCASYNLPKPLSLVVRKCEPIEESEEAEVVEEVEKAEVVEEVEKPWRPW